jgi:hypothetical protein
MAIKRKKISECQEITGAITLLVGQAFQPAPQEGIKRKKHLIGLFARPSRVGTE